MRRAPVVALGTIAGLVGVFSFHTQPTSLTVVTAPAKAATRQVTSATSTITAPPRSTESTSTSPTASATSSAGVSTSTTATTPSVTRSATGAAASYTYGVLSVSVTATGSKITNVQIASLDDGGDFRSQSIDGQSIPILEQETIEAQSADIQSVSGASYTSAGFDQSLQSALTKLGIA